MYWADAGSVFVMILVKLDPIWHQTPTPQVRPPNSPRLFSISFSTNRGTCFMSRDLVKTARSHVNETLFWSCLITILHSPMTLDPAKTRVLTDADTIPKVFTGCQI